LPVFVRNVAPAAAFAAIPPVPEGSTTATVTLTGSDAAGDTAAGLTYGFDFDGDGTYEVSGPSPTAVLPVGLLANQGSFTVHGRVTDKDGGAGTAAATVAVVNAPPTVTLTPDPKTYQENDTVTVRGTV